MPKKKQEAVHFSEMSYTFYDALGNCRHFMTIWRALHSEVFPKIMGPEYHGVPYLGESEYFNVFCVFVKEKKKCKGSSCCRKASPSVMRYVGTLKDMINPDRGVGNVKDRALGIEEEHLVKPAMNLPSMKYHYVGEFGKCRKEVYLEIGGMRRLQSWLPILRDGDLYLKPKITHGRNVYVVDVTYVVSYLKIQTFGGLPADKIKPDNNGARWEFTNDVTIAFKFIKFSCKSGGKIVPLKKKTKSRQKIPKCSWILPSGSHTIVD